ncbi:L,D-transpeptidase [Brevibacillus choshinensis]|uniref:L,D-transpeptidase n=1 Tax=Brevibacillus choshinensis TaxID=54911 RepID=A0ABX7FJ63_BRECH|nr:L,D-transpeptidase [Brevibacillus choshinensis]QRG66273.1 L,D-transpeptidase [Brevibacillus choshinensis]
MDKVSFLQEKSTFHMKHPDQSDLSFYRWFTVQHPDEAIGWYHLGRERAAHGDREQALAAFRKALHTKPGPYYNEAREAYQELLRERKQEEWRKRARLLFASLLFLYVQFAFSPGPLTEPPRSSTAAALQPSPAKAPFLPHVEVIAVPANLSAAQREVQVRRYAESRRPSLAQPYTVIAVPEVAGAPLYTPLLFYQPKSVLGVMRYHPLNRTVIQQKWFDRPGTYDQDQMLRQARAALTKEQLVLEHVLTLRNALYRYYQQKGSLPAGLSHLAGAYPGNYLPQIPVPPPGLGILAYSYRPDLFSPESAWESMRDVLPLPGYPEPLIPLEPLQIHLSESTHTLRLVSGTQVIRSYPVGIGKNGSTPEGYFTILQKINHPRGHDNIYGTRGMVFQSSGYAIHGTNHPESIGTSVSLGCIRMLNAAVEELYSFVSLGTEVILSDSQAPVYPWSNPSPFVLEARPEEETPQVIYQWLH